MICLALELVGPRVVLGFSVGMEAFDELLSINVAWIQEFSDVLRIWTETKHHPRANKFQSKTYQANSPATQEHTPEL